MAGLNAWFPAGAGDYQEYDQDTYPVSTAATFVAGDFVIYSTGLVAAASAAANFSPASATLYGYALAPATDPEFGLRTSMQIVKAMPGLKVILPLWQTSNTTSVTWDPARIGGTGYEIRCISAGIWAVDVGTQTHPVVRILAPVVEDVPTWPGSTATNTANSQPRVWCEFIGGICALTGAR